MPIPRAVARFNRRFLNPVARHLAPHLPTFGVVVHRGRRSGREFRTPVNVFPSAGGGYRVALTYGPDADWVRNVLAAGGCELVTRGRTVRLVRPELHRDPARAGIPFPPRAVLGWIDVTDFLDLAPEPGAGATEPPAPPAG
ncbi:nitroreductase family deazaflavin-dependent oxidoreductase [Nakamurella endophytica]|uniref:nitroreductase family deazaflavin-dependent oxidoreductase n=1 Tax=Nakamurella endophytica TaxID=1748367 RepID=UPI001665F58F|nr:nitroreductase family deazaflavin-dependent oxidoreductase [Nakamurella endophytica]